MSWKGKIWFFLSMFFTIMYLMWRTFFTIPFDAGVVSLVAGVSLLVVEILGMVVAFAHYANMYSAKDYPFPDNISSEEFPDVDIFVTTYSEPVDLLYQTLLCCTRMEYPDQSKVHVYLCDDGHREEMKALAMRLGVGYLAGDDHAGAKAGNLNYALAHSDSPYIVTFDADVIPESSFLMRTIPYFIDCDLRNRGKEEEDQVKLGFLQSPQNFYNSNAFQAKLYSGQGISNGRNGFYQDIQAARTRTNSVIYGGSNAVLSRKALEDIGGFYTKTAIGDFATGILMEKKQYVSLGTSEPLAQGPLPQDFKEMIWRRVRWASDVIAAGRKMHIVSSRNLTFSQKMNYWASIWYWYAPLKRLLCFLLPILCAAFHFMAFKCTLPQVLMFWLPMYISSKISLRMLGRNIRPAKWTGIYETILFPYMLIPVLLQSVGISMKKGVVIGKGGQKKRKGSNFIYTIPFLLLIGLSVTGIVKCAPIVQQSGSFALAAVLLWLVYNLFLLVMAVFFVMGMGRQRKTERIKRKKKWLAVFLILLILAAGAAAFYLWFQKETGKRTAQVKTDTLDQTDYSAKEEIAAAKKKLEENPEIPMVITDINTVDKKVALCFEGAADRLVLEQIVEYLDAHDMTAAFFISAVDAGEDQEIIDEIIDAGHDIESYTLYGSSHMENMSTDELITDFCRAQVVYEDKISKRPEFVKCNATEYTDDVLEAADASGYECIVYPTQYLNYQSFGTKEVAKNYVAGLDRGTVISIKLSGYLDELEYEEEKVDQDPAKDKQPGLELHDLEVEGLTETQRLLQVVEWFLDCLDEQEYETVRLQEFPAQDMGDLVLQYHEIEDQYLESMVEPITAVHTTDREMSFTFRGLGDEKELANLLDVLQAVEAKATFFVTGQEIELYPEQVQKIMDAGHEIGSGGYLGKSMSEMSFAEICEDIYKNDMMLEKMGVKTELFMPPSGVVTEDMQMAAAATGKQIITYNSSPARKEYVEEKYTAKESIKKYYGNGKLVFCRGDIAYFNMDIYEDSNSLADLVNTAWEMKIKPTLYGSREDNILRVTTISELLDHTWNYPAVTNASYHQIELAGKMQASWNEMLRNGYIGNPYLAAPGFSEEEKAGFDWTGRVNTGGTNTVFLTFDDWGNEQTIGKLLYVLRKHKIKASFFIRTEYVMDGTSENLLRAIAEEGHDVGSHTHTHMPIDITPDQIPALQQDLVKSNRTLANVVGDTRMLTDYFRPPTLAVNKTGLQTIYDCGYGYVISGDVSTADYHAANVDDMYDILMNGARLDSGERMPIQDGSVVVMHINTNAVHTAQALDRYFNYIESLPDGDPHKFHFAKLSDYLH